MHTRMKIMNTALGLIAAAFFASIAFASGGPHHKPHQLGGAFVGVWSATPPGGEQARIEFTMVQVPLDPQGRTAALKLEWLTVAKNFEALRNKLNVHTSEAVGEIAMINHDTAKYTAIWYGVSNDQPNVIRVIFVLGGTMTFRGADTLVSRDSIKIYLTNDAVVAGVTPPEADANHDLLPDSGALPFAGQTFAGTTHRRVPILP